MASLENVTIPRRTMNMFFLIDKSGSMSGPKIDAINSAISEVVPIIGEISDNNPDAEIKISALTFSTDVSWMYPEPVESHSYVWAPIVANGLTSMGEAFHQLDMKLQSGSNGYMTSPHAHFAPTIILISDGAPTDNYKEALEKLKQNQWFMNALKIAIAVGDDTDRNIMREFTGSEEAVIDVRQVSILRKLIRTIAISSSCIGSSISASVSRQEKVIHDIKESSILDVCDGYDYYWDDWDDVATSKDEVFKYFELGEPKRVPSGRTIPVQYPDIQSPRPRGYADYGTLDDFCTYIPYLPKQKRTIDLFSMDSSSDFEYKLSAFFGLFAFWKRFKRRRVFSSVFSPSEVQCGQHMLIQCFLHKEDDNDLINKLANETDKKAVRRSYRTLAANLKIGDIVHLSLSIKCFDQEVFHESMDIEWNGSWTSNSFDYLIPMSPISNQLLCCITASLRNVPIGIIRFTTDIVEKSRNTYAKIEAKQYKHVFISYAKEDFQRAKDFASVYKQQNINYFLDRDKLIAGDVFWEKIKNKIDESDLFVLFWSKNAQNSKSVAKERIHAMSRAYPQIQPEDSALIKILPYSIEPRADFPSDMKDIYQFETI